MIGATAWAVDYRTCPTCGQTVIAVRHWLTDSEILIDPLPHPEGYVLPDLRIGRCSVIPIKHVKKYDQLWRPHAATCLERKP